MNYSFIKYQGEKLCQDGLQIYFIFFRGDVRAGHFTSHTGKMSFIAYYSALTGMNMLYILSE